MAESFIKAAQSELTCPICMELFIEPHNPKNMPECSHVICEICLKKLREKAPKKRSFKVKCPECRKSMKIPSNNISALKTNLRLRNLAELAKNQPTRPKEEISVPVCGQHDGEKMHYYCESCNELACQACLTLSHQGHKIEGAKERYTKHAKEIDSILTRAHAKIENWNVAVDQQNRMREQVQQSHEAEVARIEQLVQLRIAEICKQGDTLKSELETVKQKAFEEINNNIQILKSHIYQAVETTNRSSETQADYRLITSANTLANLNNTNLDDPLVTDNPYINAKFTENTTPMGSIGWIKTQNRKLHLVETFGQFKRAQSIACSQDGLIAVCDLDDQQIHVFHKQDGHYKLKLKLLLHILDSKHQWRVVNLHICKDGTILVARGKFLEVYSSTGMYQKSIHTAPSRDTKVVLNCVSATTESDIIAGDVHRSLITKHNPSGTLIQSIPTTIKPRYITSVKDTHVAMSDCESGKISVIEMSSKRETLQKTISEVNGICYDEKSDCILTVRNTLGDGPQRVKEGTGVIEQYCWHTGKLVSVMAEKLYHPTDLAFTADGMLAVSDHKMIKIFKVL